MDAGFTATPFSGPQAKGAVFSGFYADSSWGSSPMAAAPPSLGLGPEHQAEAVPERRDPG
jgi:hypothetical protein